MTIITDPRRPHSSIRRRNRGSAIEEMKYLTDAEFKRMFRLSRESFYEFLSWIHRKIEPSDRGKINAYICGETRFAVTLRWLAGGLISIHPFRFAYLLPTFIKIMVCFGRQTIEAIDEVRSCWLPFHSMKKKNWRKSLNDSQGALWRSMEHTHYSFALEHLSSLRQSVRSGQFICSTFFNRKDFFGSSIIAGRVWFKLEVYLVYRDRLSRSIIICLSVSLPRWLKRILTDDSDEKNDTETVSCPRMIIWTKSVLLAEINSLTEGRLKNLRGGII